MLVCILVCKDTHTVDEACFFFKSLPINTLDFVLFGMVVTQTIELAADSVTGVYAQLLKHYSTRDLLRRPKHVEQGVTTYITSLMKTTCMVIIMYVCTLCTWHKNTYTYVT